MSYNCPHCARELRPTLVPVAGCNIKCRVCRGVSTFTVLGQLRKATSEETEYVERLLKRGGYL